MIAPDDEFGGPELSERPVEDPDADEFSEPTKVLASADK